ncbi:MAG TPA: NUDIX domain-containing protein [Verrucomicrobiae bacterium]|nr:NUDIX domain-containing protein [Verrucomicrobiae bacterium]
MGKESAGLLLYRIRDGTLKVLLVHPGGPFWQKKDAGAWTIPKGELASGETPQETAKREFEEELGFKPMGKLWKLQSVRQKAGKLVHAWAMEGDCDPTAAQSNTFTIEWPLNSGHMREFPEVDRAAFFSIPEAMTKINPAQISLLKELSQKLGFR